MSRFLQKITFSALLLPALLAVAPTTRPVARLDVSSEVVHQVSPLLFGGFLERAANQEPGPEAAVDPATGTLRPDVLALLKSLHIPILRFPGGFTVEFSERFTDLLDNPPTAPLPPRSLSSTTRPATRPVGFRFGYHEYFDLIRQTGSEPLLVVNLAGDLHPWKKLTEADVLHLAAAQVAYFNARLDQPLPPELAPYPKARAANGHPEPFGVKWWQVGNEPFVAFGPPLLKQGLSAEAVAERYARRVSDVVDAMRAVDPTIRTIAEVQMDYGPPYAPVLAAMQRHAAGKVDLFSAHVYHPWEINRLERDGQPFPVESFTPRDLFAALSTASGVDPVTGLSSLGIPTRHKLRSAGLKLAVTEWNVNYWWGRPFRTPDRRPRPTSDYAAGIGAASFLHALIRDGDVVVLANQSMLLGSRWPIGSIAVDPARPDVLPRLRASGAVTSMYSRHHGPSLLRLTGTDLPVSSQPFRVGSIPASPRVALLDPLATASASTVYLHLLQRDPDAPTDVEIALDPALGVVPEGAMLHQIASTTDPKDPLDADRSWSQTRAPISPGAFASPTTLRLTLPARSVTVVELRRSSR